MDDLATRLLPLADAVLPLLGGLSAFLIVTGVAAAVSRRPAPAPRPRRWAAPPPDGPLTRRLRRAGLTMTPVEFLLLALAVTGATAGLFYAWLPLPLTAGLGAVIGLAAVWGWAAWRAGSRREEARAAVIESAQLAAQFLATGAGHRAALDRLADEGPPALRDEWSRYRQDVVVAHSVEAALRAMASRLADPAFDVFAVTVIAAERTGGGELEAALLAHAQQALRLEAARQESDARTAELRMTALVMTLGLGGFGAALVWLSPEALAFYATPTGQVFLAAYVLAFPVAYYLMRRLMRPPAEPRLLK
jgi:tight adherence protein B